MDDGSAFHYWQQNRPQSLVHHVLESQSVPESQQSLMNHAPSSQGIPTETTKENVQPSVSQENFQGTAQVEKPGKRQSKEQGGKKAKKSKKVTKSTADGEEEDEEDVEKTRWTDTQVVHLISFRSEMDSEFAAAAGKQGVNTWFKVHRQMLVVCPGFQKSHSACKKKWDAEYKKYKDDKRFLQISGNNRHIQCRFFEEIDRAFCNRANVKKVVHHDADNSSNPCPIDGPDNANVIDKGPTLPALRKDRKEAKRSIADRLCDLLGEMVSSSKAIALVVEKDSKVFDKFD